MGVFNLCGVGTTLLAFNFCFSGGMSLTYFFADSWSSFSRSWIDFFCRSPGSGVSFQYLIASSDFCSLSISGSGGHWIPRTLRDRTKGAKVRDIWRASKVADVDCWLSFPIVIISSGISGQKRGQDKKQFMDKGQASSNYKNRNSPLEATSGL